jgi:hypothetical protein
LYRRLGGPQSWSGQVRKISPPPGFNPQTVQPVGSHYTDYATRPTGFTINVIKYSNSMITGQLKDTLVHLVLQNMLIEKARGRITEFKEEKTSFCTHIVK